jgi:hypothetical protein
VKVTAGQAFAHDRAVIEGRAGYLDPETGLFVLTEAYLADRGRCCGNACRHCPYDHVNVPER